MAERQMAEAIRERGDAKFAEAIAQLYEIRFTNLVMEAGTVHSLKSIVFCSHKSALSDSTHRTCVAAE
jgi:hypothetical protein